MIEIKQLEFATHHHQYVPHELRSHPFRCIVLPLLCGLFFIAYWFMACPLLFVSCFKHVPLLFWTAAFLVFVLIMAVAICIWRSHGHNDREQEKIAARKQEYDALLSQVRTKSNVKQLYHVTLVNESLPEKNQNNAAKLNNDTAQVKPENVDGAEKAFTKCSVKRKPDLAVQTTNLRPLSVVSNASSPKSPLTPRELFFIDLIEAANKSPAAYIPVTREFLEMERKNSLPDEARREPTKSEAEYFIASVPNQRSTTTQVFMYIPEEDEPQKPRNNIEVTLCEADDVFID